MGTQPQLVLRFWGTWHQPHGSQGCCTGSWETETREAATAGDVPRASHSVTAPAPHSDVPRTACSPVGYL